MIKNDKKSSKKGTKKSTQPRKSFKFKVFIQNFIFFFRLKRIPIFFDYEISETFICFSGVFSLNGYMGKKVQKNFLMGFKIW